MIFNQLFANYLKTKGILDAKTIDEWREKSDRNSSPMYLELARNGIISEEEIFRQVGEYYGFEYRFVQLSEINLSLIEKFPKEKLIEFEVVPFEEDDKSVTFLFSNPLRLDDSYELQFYCQKQFKFIITPATQMKNIMVYATNKANQSSVITEFQSEQSGDITDVDENDVTIDAPVIKLVDSILNEAIVRGASDIHIEPFEKTIRIRFRIDGKLVISQELPTHLFPAILARIKIMAEMNIAERRIPQDGKISLIVENNPYDFRVNSIPTLHGEKIVIRIFNVSFKSRDLTALGFNETQREMINSMITRPHGIILLTGPTGSGKSTTLYTFLRSLNNEDTNIITVEDPVENEIVGINQVQVNAKADMTFASALRSILRQDPNVIMIGEIRDEETAQIATRAAITGHLVLSSIHTNDAAGVVARLINMGIPKYLVADSLLGSISQRLVRKLCPKCKHEHITTKAEMTALGINKATTIYEPTGCPYCNNTGYVGRIGVFEIMLLDEELRDLIMSDDFNSERLNEVLFAKMPTLLENARDRVLSGETSMSEFDALSEVVAKE